ncbi:MAG: hypothetical protein ACETWM_03710 [Candidatus Lokiarchaeia archaeon]
MPESFRIYTEERFEMPGEYGVELGSFWIMGFVYSFWGRGHSRVLLASSDYFRARRSMDSRNKGIL